MKLEEQYLKIACHNAMIMQYADMLRAEGYLVNSEKELAVGSSHLIADLYAEKNSEKRIYEFKIVGDNPAQQKNINRFKEFAKTLNAIPFVVYVNLPTEKEIEIDDFALTLLSHFHGVGIPSELDELSTHTMIEEIEIDELTSLKISSESITVTGDAMIYVNLGYGSGSDDGVDMTADFPMTFTAELNSDLSIEHLDYDIDTSSWNE